MPYQYVTVDTQLDESKWVQAIEIQPGSPEVVHHVIITLQITVKERGLANQEEDGLWAVMSLVSLSGNIPPDSPVPYRRAHALFFKCTIHQTVVRQPI